MTRLTKSSGRAGAIRVRTRAFAALGLGLLGDPASLPVLARLAGLPGTVERSGSAWRLEASRSESRRDVPVCAAVALGLHGAGAAPFAERMARIVADRRADPFVRAHLLAALGKIGDRSVLPAVRRAYRDPDVHVRRSAILALGRLADTGDDSADDSAGDSADAMLAAAATRATDPQSRHWALVGLGQTGRRSAEKILRQALADGTPDEQAFGALGLALLAKRRDAARPASEVLRSAFLRARSADVRGAICIALGIVGSDDAIPVLSSLLPSRSNPELRGYAAIGLGMLEARDALPVIRRTLEESSREPELQRATAIALGLMGDRSASRLLVERIRNARTEFVKGSAARALGHLGDTAAVGTLIEIAADREGAPYLARAHAVVALGVLAERTDLPVLHVLGRDLNYRALPDALAEALSLH